MNRFLKSLIFVIPITFFSCQLTTEEENSTETGHSSDIINDTLTLGFEYFNKAEKFPTTLTDSAIVYYEKAGEFYKQNKTWDKYVVCYKSISNAFSRIGQYNQAIESLKEAAKICKQSLMEDHHLIAEIYGRLGILHDLSGLYDMAQDYHQQALTIRLKVFGESHPKVARSLNHLGIIFWRKSNFDKALDLQQRSLAIRIQNFKETHPEVAQSYNSIGLIYKDMGSYDKALEYYQKSLQIQLEAYGNDHPHTAGSYNNIGTIYTDKNDLNKALEYYQKSLSIKLRILDENDPYIAGSHINIGKTYYDKKLYNKALVSYDQALDMIIKSYGEQNPEVALIYNNIGDTYNQKDQYSKALEYYQKSLSIWLETVGENSSNVATSYFNIGDVYYKRNEYDKAFEHYQISLAITLQVFGANHPYIAETYQGIGKIYEQRRKYMKALLSYQKAIIAVTHDFSNSSIYANPTLKGVLSYSHLLSSLFYKALALEKLYSSQSHNVNDLKLSLLTYELSSSLIDSIRSSYETSDSKLFLGEQAANIFENAVAVSLKLNELYPQMSYERKAFFFSEKAKTGILLESMREAEAKRFVGIPDHIIKTERELQEQIFYLETIILQEQQEGIAANKIKLDIWQNKLFDFKEELRAHIKNMENNYPQYYYLKYSAHTVSIEEVQAFLDNQTVMIEYLLGDDYIYVFVVSKFDFGICPIPKDNVFKEKIGHFLSAIQKKKYILYTDTAHGLYQILIAPIENLLAKLKAHKLIIIPDGIINKIPFEALLTSQPMQGTDEMDFVTLPYLINDYAISYAYSATLLHQYSSQNDNEQPEYDYIGFAPIFSESAGSDTALTNLLRNWTVKPTNLYLPNSREEVNSIRDMFTDRYNWWDKFFSKKSRTYLEDEAHKDNITSEQLANYRYIHFSTHAFLNDSIPKLSGILLARNPNTKKHDVLYLGEIYSLKLNADLVSLSACETGKGKIAKGEGLIGLSRGLIYAGAKNLLVTLWKVDDENSAQLMSEFYKLISAGKSKSEALQQAKLTFIQNNPLEALPINWAPFVLIGQ